MEYVNLIKSLDEVGKDIIIDITNKLLAADKKATGELINSLNYKILDTANGLVLNILANETFKYVDGGRRAGAIPPPAKAIIPWVQAKGIKFTTKSGKSMSVEQTAFIIARSIGENGIKPLNIKQKVIEDFYKNKTDLIQRGISLDITEYIKDLFKGQP